MEFGLKVYTRLPGSRQGPKGRHSLKPVKTLVVVVVVVVVLVVAAAVVVCPFLLPLMIVNTQHFMTRKVSDVLYIRESVHRDTSMKITNKMHYID